jgi:FtsP/CotA-like multicopper oxidase with cupredoxin domain
MRPRATTTTGLGFALMTATLLLHASPAQAAVVTFNLCANTGTVALPDPATPDPANPVPISIPIWGFALDGGSGCGTPAAPGPATLPGPVLIVTQNDDVTINLTNNLGQAVSILFPGQAMLPDTVGASANGGTTSYSFTASAPGTYLYGAGRNPDVQVPMGLYGALIVRPLSFPGVPGRAYSGAGTAFDTEAVLVLSDLDPLLNANPSGFNLANYNPTYWLINGKAYPDTAPIPVSPAGRLLLRYVNAGSTNSAMTLVGLRQTVVATDAFELVQFPINLASQTIPSGQTSDMIVVGPTTPGRFPLYNRQMHLTNGVPNLTPPLTPGQDRGIAAPHFPGGMMTFVSVPALLAFSTAGNNAIPGVLTPFDDADIYAWSGVAYARLFDGSGVGLLAGADIDALKVVDFDTFYISFAVDAGTTVPGLGLVPDEDIVKYNAGTWSLYFDGSAVGLGDTNGEDVDAFDILADGSIVVSTRAAASVPGVAASASQDLLHCVPPSPGPITACTWTVYFDGSDVGLSLGTENIDGVAVSGSNIYLSTTGAFAVPGLVGEGKDVFACNGAIPGDATSCASFSMYFDGSVRGLPTATNLDAIDLP